jgi:serine/threonine-protein kinase
MILDQNPLPETRVKTGAPVLVKVSAGQKMTTVPDLRRRNVPQAEIMIQDAGLRSGIRSEIESAVVSPGMIVTTDPPPNASAARESRVNLLISAGPSKVEIGMPRLTGRSIEEASQLLALLGLAIDETYEEPRNDIAPGVVVSQSPLPGIIVSEEDSIRLVIALKSSRETAGGPGSNPVNVLKVLDYN